MLLFGMLLTGCENAEQTSIKTKKESIESIYKVEYQITKGVENTDNKVSISIIDSSIKERDGLLIFVSRNFSIPSRSYIIFYNYNIQIPSKFYYAIESSQMIYDDKQEYEKYKEELKKAYEETISECNLSSDDLMEIAQYVYENK